LQGEASSFPASFIAAGVEAEAVSLGDPVEE